MRVERKPCFSCKGTEQADHPTYPCGHGGCRAHDGQTDYCRLCRVEGADGPCPEPDRHVGFATNGRGLSICMTCERPIVIENDPPVRATEPLTFTIVTRHHCQYRDQRDRAVALLRDLRYREWTDETLEAVSALLKEVDG